MPKKLDYHTHMEDAFVGLRLRIPICQRLQVYYGAGC